MLKLFPNKNQPKMIRKNDMSTIMEDLLQMAPRGITTQLTVAVGHGSSLTATN
jgi:hypothetical protein